MKSIDNLSHIIPSIECDNKIMTGQNKLFLSEETFSINGIDILKNSLVYTNGVEVFVNLIPFNVLVAKHLATKDELENIDGENEGRVLWDRVGSVFYSFGVKTCYEFNKKYNIYKEGFPGSAAYPYLELIKNIQILSLNKIHFSSLAYSFKLEDNEVSFTDFINMGDYEFESKSGKKINIPPFVEIDLKTSNFFPLQEINIQGINTISDINYFGESDTLHFQSISKELATERIDNRSGYVLNYPTGSPIEIDFDGFVYWRGFVNDKIENWKLKLKK